MLIVYRIQFYRSRDVLEIRLTRCQHALGPCSLKTGNQNCDQDAKDCDDDHQLDQRKS
jgi:hypothetical protein